MWRVECGAYDVSMVGWWALLERVAFGGSGLEYVGRGAAGA